MLASLSVDDSGNLVGLFSLMMGIVYISALQSCLSESFSYHSMAGCSSFVYRMLFRYTFPRSEGLFISSLDRTRGEVAYNDKQNNCY